MKITLEPKLLDVLGEHRIQLLMFQINPIMRGRSQQLDISQLRKQYQKFTEEEFSKNLSSYLITCKVKNTFKLLQWIKNKVPLDLSKNISGEINLFEDLIRNKPKLTNDLWREILLSWEAKLAKRYYSIIREVLKAYDWEFIKRSRRPALDEFNSMLNYGYAVLKSNITKVLLALDLDIYVGFFHTLRAGRESLTLDIIEFFRHKIVDQAIFELILNKKVQKINFTHQDNMISLGSIAKSELVRSINNKLFYNADPMIKDIITKCEYIQQKINN